MAENESLELGSSYAKRWEAPCTAIQHGEPCEKVASKVSRALCGGLRKALKQIQKRGVTLADLLNARDSRPRLRQLVRQTEGHQYAQLFESAAHASGPTVEECLRGWMEAILDKISDQICLRVVETDQSRTLLAVAKRSRFLASWTVTQLTSTTCSVRPIGPIESRRSSFGSSRPS
jgi:hypothetical protein